MSAAAAEYLGKMAPALVKKATSLVESALDASKETIVEIGISEELEWVKAYSAKAIFSIKVTPATVLVGVAAIVVGYWIFMSMEGGVWPTGGEGGGGGLTGMEKPTGGPGGLFTGWLFGS